MLSKLIVRNFKGFKDDFVFDLSDTKNYEFNADLVKNGIANKAIIYGPNGCGKSNLGLAIFDLILHLTDKEKLFNRYPVYLNLDSKENHASFEYDFLFDSKKIIYEYQKTDMQNLINEKLTIDNQVVLEYDFVKDEGQCNLDGTQSLRLSSPDGKLSKLKFIKNNAILVENEINHLFIKMMDFVDHMLLFYSLMDRGYQGFMLGSEQLADAIVKSGNVGGFEKFLNKAGIHEKLSAKENNGQNQLFFKYLKGEIPFEIAASTGTKTLELFYYWYLKIKDASFVFMDEFDAFYHYELSDLIVQEIKECGAQVIMTTHNTDLLSNDLLRPDCYFEMDNTHIRALSASTQKELRRAHNIQKMYKAGAF